MAIERLSDGFPVSGLIIQMINHGHLDLASQREEEGTGWRGHEEGERENEGKSGGISRGAKRYLM